MKKTILSKPAVIAGNYHPAGTEIAATPETIAHGYKMADRQKVRRGITRQVGDAETLLGITSDAAAYAIDQIAIDILALADSADSSYKNNRINLHEQFYGEGSWAKTVTFCQQWFDQRKTQQITLPVDIKGIESVFADVAASGTGVATVLKAAQA